MQSYFQNLERPMSVLLMQNIIDIYTRYYDLIVEGEFPFFDPDLPTITNALNSEYNTLLNTLKQDLPEEINYSPPYEFFDLDKIVKTWYISERPKLHKIYIEISKLYKPGQSSTAPTEFVALTNYVNNSISKYELKKYKYQIQQYNLTFREQKDRNASQKNNRDIFLPPILFEFISDSNIKLSIWQFYQELRDLYLYPFYRAAIIISGALIEALLIECLKSDKNKALEYAKKTKNYKENIEIEHWKFELIIEVSVNMCILPDGLYRQLDAIRNFRNYVHIHKDTKADLQLNENLRDIALNCVKIVIDYSNKWFDKLKINQKEE